MRIITTVIALLMAVANIQAQGNMKENVDFSVWPKGELNSAYAQYFFIGYPRTLNALNCIRSVESDK